MQNIKNNRALRTALVVGITLGSAAAMTATDVQAFGWSDVTGAAKKVGGAVKDGAKKVGGTAYKAHKTVRRAKKAVRDVARDAVGQAHIRPIYGLGEGIDYTISKARGTYDAEEHANRWRNSDRDTRTIVDAVNSYNGVKDRVKRKIIDTSQDAARKAWEKAQTGKLTFVPPRNPGYRPGQWGQNGNPLAQGLVNRTPKKQAPVQGITLKNTRPAKGLTSQITLQRGKPAGPNTIPLGKTGNTAPVQGIRKENLRPAKGKRPITAKQGRPVGKANTKTVQKNSARNVPPHKGSKTPASRPRNYPNYPPKRDYPDYPGAKSGGKLANQGKAASGRSLAGRPVGGKKPVGNDRSLAGRPVGGRKPIGNDRSVWGRPVGGKKPVGQDRSKVWRPMGITKQNLQPRHKVKRALQTKQKVSRDLSRNKSRKGRNGRTLKIKRQNFKAQGKRKSFQQKRGNAKRSFNKGGRGNRRG